MKRLRYSVLIVCIMVFLICMYSFLLGNGSFKGKFENDSIAWYFLAKGLFCSVALYLLMEIIQRLNK
ncbi:MAG: hypothetical protein JW938_00560 [Candidatus Omnitrophica bacterium]|nr:hypothetical protein [Candidatus Omnitrophota bacterium]